MELSSTFNSAADGPGSDAASVSGSDLGPAGPAPSGAEAAAHTSDASLSADQGYLTEEFNEAAEGLAQDEEPDEDEEFGIDQAQAELEALERGRPQPNPRHDREPPPRIQRPAQDRAERGREIRIAQLRAFLETAPEGPQHEAQHEFADGLEFHLSMTHGALVAFAHAFFP